jgi:hypothetical protein
LQALRDLHRIRQVDPHPLHARLLPRERLALADVDIEQHDALAHEREASPDGKPDAATATRDEHGVAANGDAPGGLGCPIAIAALR